MGYIEYYIVALTEERRVIWTLRYDKYVDRMDIHTDNT